jgi:uncharacterized protein (DUF2147 family)
MRYTMGFAVLLSLLSGAAMAAEEDALTGTWLTQGHDARIEISKAENGIFEGKLVWIEKSTYDAGDAEAGKPIHDRENPDPAKRDRPMVGMKMLEGFKYAGGKLWKGGTIYDPKEGKTYKCKLTLTGDNRLDVRGFIGISLLGRTEHWTRYVEEEK